MRKLREITQTPQRHEERDGRWAVKEQKTDGKI